MMNLSTFSLMIRLPLLLLLLQSPSSTQATPTPPLFNISRFLYPKVNDHDLRPQVQQSPLKDVLEAIAKREKWDLEDVRVLKLDPATIRYGSLKKNEIRVRFGKKAELVFKVYDQVSTWNKLKRGRTDFESFIKEIGSGTVLDTFRIEGPLELLVGGDDELSLMLPLNTSHLGLKRILVGEGISLDVSGAQEVSLFHTSDFHQQWNESVFFDKKRNGYGFGTFWPSSCMPFFPIRILGSASVVAYRTRSPDAYIETAFLSSATIELLPDKCYGRKNSRRHGFPIDNLNKRIALLEKLLGSSLGNRTNGNLDLGYVKAKIKASTIFRFQLELERDIRSNDTIWAKLAEWRTRPTVERVWFEVLARNEAETLKPLIIKKVRPFVAVESSAWSNLMSNISFTKFPSILVPPEALTLDVKW